MIARIVFADLIPLGLQGHLQTFDVELGWTITEEAPGRVHLCREVDGCDLTVQGHSYTLHHEPDPAPESPGPDLVEEAAAILRPMWTPPSKADDAKHRGRRRS